jgi:hypothetical protein
MGKPTPTPPASPQPPPLQFWQRLFRRRHSSREKAIKKAVDGLKMGFRPLDLPGCLSILRKFTGLKDEQLASRLGISLSKLIYMESHNQVDPDVYDRMSNLAFEYYLPVEIIRWFSASAAIKRSKKRPTRQREVMGEGDA